MLIDMQENAIGAYASSRLHLRALTVQRQPFDEDKPMKIWNKPQVREQEVGLEVTSYLPAEIDII